MTLDKAQLVAQVFQLMTAHWMPLAVYTAVKLDILEIMPLSEKINSGAIADQLSLNAEYTYRLMRAVCAAGILMEKSHDQFSITEKGCLLRSDGQPSLRNSVLLEAGPVHVRSWTHLSKVIKNGPPVNGVKEEYGCDTFVGLLESNAEYAQVFNGAMTSYSNMENDLVRSCYDFSGYSTVMDVGGGHGMLLASIAKDYPNLSGKVMDLESVVKESTILKDLQLSDRIELVPGDFFTGQGLSCCDLYLMKHIIHDWDDESCIKMLKNLLNVSKKTSKLLVCDFVVAEPGSQSTGAELCDMHMMVMTTGKERTQKEMKDLMLKSGWNLTKTINTPNPMFALYEAQPL